MHEGNEGVKEFGNNGVFVNTDLPSLPAYTTPSSYLPSLTPTAQGICFGIRYCIHQPVRFQIILLNRRLWEAMTFSMLSSHF